MRGDSAPRPPDVGELRQLPQIACVREERVLRERALDAEVIEIGVDEAVEAQAARAKKRSVMAKASSICCCGMP